MSVKVHFVSIIPCGATGSSADKALLLQWLAELPKRHINGVMELTRSELSFLSAEERHGWAVQGCTKM